VKEVADFHNKALLEENVFGSDAAENEMMLRLDNAQNVRENNRNINGFIARN